MPEPGRAGKPPTFRRGWGGRHAPCAWRTCLGCLTARATSGSLWRTTTGGRSAVRRGGFTSRDRPALCGGRLVRRFACLACARAAVPPCARGDTMPCPTGVRGVARLAPQPRFPTRDRPARARSSTGQSGPLITAWLQVRVLPGAPVESGAYVLSLEPRLSKTRLSKMGQPPAWLSRREEAPGSACRRGDAPPPRRRRPNDSGQAERRSRSTVPGEWGVRQPAHEAARRW